MPLIHFPLVVILSLSALLFGCAGPQAVKLKPGAEEAWLQQDAQLIARPYLRLAGQSQPPKRNQYLLQAATILLQGDYPDQARNILAGLDDDDLTPGQLIEKYLLLARTALAADDPTDALNHLATLKSVQLEDPQHARRYFQSLAESFALQSNATEEAWARLTLDAYLDRIDREANLARVETLIEQLMGAPVPTEPLDETAMIVPMQSIEGRIQQLTSRLNDWMILNYGHAPLSHVESRSGIITAQPPRQIAVLLPTSGTYAVPAQAIRDGLMSEYYQRIKPYFDVDLRFYDTAGDDTRAADAYQRAVDEGARFVIGPLTKEGVTALSSLKKLPVPVLALNYGSNPAPPPRLYQFGLSPEDEARQAAERAIADGHRHAIVLVPDNAWGQRIGSAFVERLQALEGDINSLRYYDANSYDFSRVIREALELDSSDLRHRRLQDALGEYLKFTPRRRQDVDFIFVAAQPQQARLLRPQLRFHYASELPIYSTSHIYDGRDNAQKDRDMDDIIFGDIPWVLSPIDKELLKSVKQTWPVRDEKYQRLFALGIDAMAIAGLLHNLPLSLTHHGETGVLHLDESRRIYRQVRWAQFQDGIPQLLP